MKSTVSRQWLSTGDINGWQKMLEQAKLGRKVTSDRDCLSNVKSRLAIGMTVTTKCLSLAIHNCETWMLKKQDDRHIRKYIKQESPAIADKPARRESLPKLLQFDVPKTLSLTILAYFHAFNCYCVRNPRNTEKFTENSNLWSSRSSKVIDLGANRKPICDLLLGTNSNFSRICCRFRDIHG